MCSTSALLIQNRRHKVKLAPPQSATPSRLSCIRRLTSMSMRGSLIGTNMPRTLSACCSRSTTANRTISRSMILSHWMVRSMTRIRERLSSVIPTNDKRRRRHHMRIAMNFWRRAKFLSRLRTQKRRFSSIDASRQLVTKSVMS